MTTIRTALSGTPPAMLDRELRTAVAGMSKTLRGVPAQFKAWRFDVTRSEKRAKPLGRYPEYALAVLRSGASVADTIAPLNELLGWIRSHAPRITCIASAVEVMQKEQGEADLAKLRLMRNADNPSVALVDECIRELNELIAAAEVVRDALYARRYNDNGNHARVGGSAT